LTRCNGIVWAKARNTPATQLKGKSRALSAPVCGKKAPSTPYFIANCTYPQAIGTLVQAAHRLSTDFSLQRNIDPIILCLRLRKTPYVGF